MKLAGPAFFALSLLSMASAASAQTAPPAPPPSPAPPARPSAAETAARLPKARALVALVNPKDQLLEANMQGWEAAIAQMFVLDPAAKSIEQRYPGAARAAIEAARPLARDYCRRFVNEVIEYKASLIAERLNHAELDTAIAFFASTEGRRFVQRMLSHADPAALGRDVASRAAETGQVSVSPDKVRQMERDAARSTVSEMSAADNVALLRFGQTSAALKIKEVSTEVDRFALDKANHPDPEWMSRQSELVNKTILAFVDAHRTS
jgi:hypothetical protein